MNGIPWKEDPRQPQGHAHQQREFNFAPWTELPRADEPAAGTQKWSGLRVNVLERCAALLGIIMLVAKTATDPPVAVAAGPPPAAAPTPDSLRPILSRMRTGRRAAFAWPVHKCP